MWEDSIVGEVRQARLDIERECGGDFQRIYERALKIQQEIAEKRLDKDKKETEFLAA